MVTRMNLAASMHQPAAAPDLKYCAGFTLIELMTVITIVAVLMALGVPSYQYVTNTNRISGEVNGLLGDMQYARSEAIKEGQTVTVCASSNSTATPPACSGSTSWQNGWIVFSDPNGNQTVDVNETVIHVQRPFALGDTFVANLNVSSVTFNREGFALGIPNTVTITLHAATPNASSTRCVQLTKVGQLSTEAAGTGACS
jgi:type IV fimbrial biogenesis protein FimT